MDTNRVKGTDKKVAGTFKKALGTVSGNDPLGVKGEVQKAEETVQTKFGKAKDAATNG